MTCEHQECCFEKCLISNSFAALHAGCFRTYSDKGDLWGFSSGVAEMVIGDDSQVP